LILPDPYGEEYGIEEVRVPGSGDLAGKLISMIERDNGNVRIVALKRGSERIALVPAAQTEVRAGDLLVAIGARASLRRLAEALVS
jgi:Trk K+ transport system NAD-binding subunit